jgi:uncharacterized protein YoaH (UPF0181 family)
MSPPTPHPTHPTSGLTHCPTQTRGDTLIRLTRAHRRIHRQTPPLSHNQNRSACTELQELLGHGLSSTRITSAYRVARREQRRQQGQICWRQQGVNGRPIPA